MDIFNSKVLIVENDRNTAKSISSSVKNFGISKVDIVRNEKSAIEYASLKQLDLIILSKALPTTNAFSLIQKLKRLHGNDKSHYVLVADEVSSEDAEKVVLFGFDDYIIKPFTLTELIIIVKDILYETHTKLNMNLFHQRKNNSNAHLKAGTNKSTSTNIEADKLNSILVVDDLSTNIDVVVGFLQGLYHSVDRNHFTRTVDGKK